MRPLDDSILAAAVAKAIAARFGSGVSLQAVHLFGSAARGELHRDSDIDLAILVDAPLERLALYEAAQDVAVEIGRDVDLLDLRSLPTVMAANIVAEGRMIACQDRTAAEEFAMRTLTEYVLFNEIRRPAVEAFLAPYREASRGR